MKKSIYLLALLSSFSSYACLKTDSKSICPGDFATVGSIYSRGARVVSVNVRTQMVGLRSISNGSIYSHPTSEVLIGKGCVDNVCVGDFATVGSIYSRGARVISLNRVTRQVGLRSISNGSIDAHPVRDVLVGTGCVEGICVGDFATVGAIFTRGAKVISVNKYKKTIGLKSINNASIMEFPARDVLIGQECLDYSSSDRALEFYFPKH